MKQPWEWNEDDLEVLIAAGTKESIESRVQGMRCAGRNQ